MAALESLMDRLAKTEPDEFISLSLDRAQAVLQLIKNDFSHHLIGEPGFGFLSPPLVILRAIDVAEDLLSNAIKMEDKIEARPIKKRA